MRASPSLCTRVLAGLVVLAFSMDASARSRQPLRSCGQGYDGLPFPSVRPPDPDDRACAAPAARNYQRRYEGLAYEVLDLESEACFVPDSSYALLDSLIDEIRSDVARSGVRLTAPNAMAAMTISDVGQRVLARRGFRIHIPTEIISDALTPRLAAGVREHMIDCDTFSMILITVAESYGLPAALVEIRLNKTAGHNYVRWLLPGNDYVDWDTNDGDPCTTPNDVRDWEGRAMSRDEVLAYVLVIRASNWKGPNANARAFADLRRAMEIAPQRPQAYNAFAWRVATTAFEGRREVAQNAIAAAEHAVSRAPDEANFLDTLACALAYDGQYSRARDIQAQAALLSNNDPDFVRRLGYFSEEPYRDCTGE